MASKSKATSKKPTAAARTAPKTRTVRRTTSKITTVQKPVVHTGTWIAILLLVAVAAFAFFFNKNKTATAAKATPTPGTTYAFSSADGQPSMVAITASAGDSVKIEKGTDGQWKLTQPMEAAADQGSAQAAVDQIATLQTLNELDNNASLDIFGLDKPQYTITMDFNGGKQHKLEIGSATPTDSGYYARIDGTKLVILSKAGVEGLLNLLKAPPYLATPTPSPIPPTETPAASFEGSPTPAP